MSSARREPSLNPRQRRRRRLDSSSHQSVEVSSETPSQPVMMGLGQSSHDNQQTDADITFDSPTRSYRSPNSTRLRRSTQIPGPLISLDQIMASDDRPSMARHASLFQSIFSDGDESSDESGDSGDSDRVQVQRSLPRRSDLPAPPSIPAQAHPPAQFNIPDFPWATTQHRPTRDRAAELYNIWRDLNNRHPQPAPFAGDPSVVLLYKLNSANGESPINLQDPVVSSPSLRYLPLVPAYRSHGGATGTKNYTIQPSHQQRIDASQLAASRARWVPNQLPVELFDAITRHLSRDDIKSMRLVNKEFERGVSRSLFDTVVVPFNTELYDMIEQERSVTVRRDVKGKRRIDDPINTFIDLEPGSLQWKNAKEDREDKVYRGHGIQVFEGFGGHIRRFGMSFEIREGALQNPPQKSALDQVESYFGSYDWPSPEYTRFEKLAGLERTADETSQMKLAFSHLQKVQQLALSMDSGLGWMNGPDRSLRNHILQRPPQVFGCSHGIVDAQQQDRARLWETLETAHHNAGTLDELKEGHLERVDLRQRLSEIRGLADTPYVHPDSWSNVPTDAMAGALDDKTVDDSNTASTGVLYVSVKSAADTRDHRSPSPQGEGDKEINKKPIKQSFSPANLTKYQKEWLLEAEWAQRAFLSSYMLAIVDNSPIFERVTVINLARISSRLVPLFSREDFWDALPNLVDVTLGVIPDWRTVERDEAGFVETKEIEPSQAVEKSYNLLDEFVGPRSSIKKLKFSWAAGGEHAEGIFARNHHLLPAPVTLLTHVTSPMHNEESTIKLPHIHELTLSNCWMTPNALVNLVNNLQKASLKKLTLDSVSLTAYPRTANVLANAINQHMVPVGVLGPGPGPAHPPAPFNAAGGNFPVQFGAQVWQGPPQGVAYNVWAQAMLQTMHLMMQQHGIQLQQLPNIWTNHPTGMSMQQIVGMLSTVANGGANLPALVQPGIFFQQQQHQGTQVVNFGPQFFAQAQAGAVQQPAVAAPPPIAPMAPPVQVNHNAQTNQILVNRPWYEEHRHGSWVSVVDALSPGPRLESYRPRDEFDAEPEPRETGLACIEFISCGYTQLKSASFDQGVIEAPMSHRMGRYFARRHSLLSPAMLASSDKHLGKVVQYMANREQEALRFAWGFRMGWQDEKLAKEAEYDGYLAGGTGRFSGVLTKDTPLGLAAHS